MRALLAALCAVIVSGCVTTQRGLDVGLTLNTVQRPQDVAERWGDYTLEPADSAGYTYADALISITVIPGGGTFAAILENRSEHSIKLLWSEASYVGPSGLSTGVVPGDTRWIAMGNTPAPQVIPAQAKAAVVMIPRANANTSAMSITDFYPRSAPCSVVPGTSIRLILPFEIQGVTNEYTLQFVPHDARMVTWKTNQMDGTRVEAASEPCR